MFPPKKRHGGESQAEGIRSSTFWIGGGGCSCHSVTKGSPNGSDGGLWARRKSGIVRGQGSKLGAGDQWASHSSWSGPIAPMDEPTAGADRRESSSECEGLSVVERSDGNVIVDAEPGPDRCQEDVWRCWALEKELCAGNFDGEEVSAIWKLCHFYDATATLMP